MTDSHPTTPKHSDLDAIKVGVPMPRDMRVMTRYAGEYMMKTPNGWMVGPKAAVMECAIRTYDYFVDNKDVT